MLHTNVVDFENTTVSIPFSIASQRLAPETYKVVDTLSRSARHAIRSRMRRTADGWSKQERADRLRDGIARLAWLSNLVDQPKTP